MRPVSPSRPRWSEAGKPELLQRTGRRQLQSDLEAEAEDPYLTTFSHPCGPWGAWSRFNLARGGAAADTVLSAREATRPR